MENETYVYFMTTWITNPMEINRPIEKIFAKTNEDVIEYYKKRFNWVLYSRNGVEYLLEGDVIYNDDYLKNDKLDIIDFNFEFLNNREVLDENPPTNTYLRPSNCYYCIGKMKVSELNEYNGVDFYDIYAKKFSSILKTI